MNNKAPKPTTEQITACELLLVAMAYTQTVKPIIQKIETDLLEKYQYKWDTQKCKHSDINELVERKGTYCKREFDTYLISDADFGHFLTEKHAAFTAQGFKVKEFGYCPLLVAENLERQARRHFIDSMEPVTKMSYDMVSGSKDCVKNIMKIADLSLRYVTPFTNTKKLINATGN
jgi:hypothetical protein